MAGIVYVTDVNENKKIPTCNNITENSFMNDKDVQKAISLAPADIADGYKNQAEYIEKVRVEWLEKASKEPAYDVFISFKDSDRENGIERTQDSIDAQDLYNALVAEGYKVFFSRISLRDKISEQYEPYIYNAIKTAKVMIVFGEKATYFNSVWIKNEWTAWSESERSVMEQILLKHGLRREDKNVHRPHLSVDDYKKAAHEAEQINKLNAYINELKKKPAEELTTDEAALINNQNDVMRAKVTELRQQIEDMSKKAGADFVPVNIYSPDKLQYTADGLARAKIPCVAESNTLYIPDYALRTAQAIASHYKPDEKAPTIREKIKLDIDRLVYRTETLDDLLHRLQERGYEVKYGKYVSVKHSPAERFMRLKNLGDEYLPKNLEIRIAEKDMFTDRVRYEVQNASPIEKRFHITLLNITTAVKQFRLEPKKTDRRRYYFFQNDARINYLSEQLATIGEFELTSRDSIYAKAQELQRTIHKKRSEGDNPEEEEYALKRINTLIKAYEEIVEGNYIDNLIKAQQEEKQAAEQNANAHKNTTKKAQKR
ncbi:MAG: toll/interleukin-1 receptor domain-containing protein [Oscillospiraceae bacterium]